MMIFIYNEKYFSDDQFYYIMCPNLEGTKDALGYKFRIIVVLCAQTRLHCQ